MKIKDGDELCVFGEPYKVDRKIVGGAPEFLDRRVRDIIKRQFLVRARAIMREMPFELHPKKVLVKDTRSRWGSCSASGAVALSWRLSFAPVEVMRYVVIHECCHLVQMNHSAKFWALVGRHFGPGYEGANRWLRKNGQRLLSEY
jgi:predicted metal-dependent hydrolase